MGLILPLIQLLLVAQALVSAVVIPSDTGSNNLGYYLMKAEKLRGSTIADAKKGAQPVMLVERDGDGYLNMALQNENTFYMTELVIGSDSQKVGVLVDTGSSDLWVVASNNTYCESGTTGSLSSKRVSNNAIFDRTDKGDSTEENKEATKVQNKATSSSVSSSDMIDCSEYGTFDETSSSSFQSNGTSFSIQYADNTFAKGVWGTDNVVISDVNVEGLSFAVCDNTDNPMGVLGIGLAGLETTYSGSLVTSLSNAYTYENLPLRLKSLGITSSVSYSIYLNDTTAEDANILFGAIDHKRYTGDLVALPIINTLSSYGYDDAIQLEVTLNSITIADTGSNTEAVIASGAGAALLDTGTTLTYVPSSVLLSILNVLDAEYSSSLGYYVTQCSGNDDIQLQFNLQGQTISVPLSSFLVSLQTTSGSTSQYCMIGILSSQSTDFTLGDSFLRYVYMVADLENMVVGIAQADHGSEGEDIEIISSSIPSAVSPSQTKTWGGSNTAMAAVSAASMSSAPSGSTVGTSISGNILTTDSNILSDNTETARTSGMTRTTTTRSTSSAATVSSISSQTARAAADTLHFSFGLGIFAVIAALI